MSDHDNKSDGGPKACECPFCAINAQFCVMMDRTLAVFMSSFGEHFGELPEAHHDEDVFTISACGNTIKANLAQDADPATATFTKILAVRHLIASTLYDRGYFDAARPPSTGGSNGALTTPTCRRPRCACSGCQWRRP